VNKPRERELLILLDAFVPEWETLMDEGDWSYFVREFQRTSGKSRATAYRFAKRASELRERKRTVEIPGTPLFPRPAVQNRGM